jgi:hypothetical protein
MANKIRRLLIGKEVKDQFSYNVGGEQNIYIDKKPIKIMIHSIEELEKHLVVNVKFNDEIQEWKKIAKNDCVTIEYFLD